MDRRRKTCEPELALRGSSSQLGEEELEGPRPQERNKPEGPRGPERASRHSVAPSVGDFREGTVEWQQRDPNLSGDQPSYPFFPHVHAI